MVYGIYDNRIDTETSISWLRSKKVAKGAMVSTTDTPRIIPNLAAGDIIYCAGIDRFVIMARLYKVCFMIYQRNLVEGYLFLGREARV